MTNDKWLGILAPIAVLASALCAETHCPGNVASVPLRPVNRYQMIVAASVNHSGPYEFLLDTGTQVTILDRSLGSDLHLSASGLATVIGVGFHESASTANVDVLQVGNHALSGHRVIIADLVKMKAVDPRIRGILGEDFFQHFDILIDNGHDQLCLDDAGIMRASLKGERVPFLSQAERPGDSEAANPLIVNVHFENGRRPIHLKLDSGTNAPFLYNPSEYLALGVINGPSLHGQGADGAQKSFVALRPQTIEIGSIAFSGVSFLALRNERRVSPPDAFDGLLPTGLFRRIFLSRSSEFAVFEPRF